MCAVFLSTADSVFCPGLSPLHLSLSAPLLITPRRGAGRVPVVEVRERDAPRGHFHLVPRAGRVALAARINLWQIPPRSHPRTRGLLAYALSLSFFLCVSLDLCHVHSWKHQTKCLALLSATVLLAAEEGRVPDWLPGLVNDVTEIFITSTLSPAQQRISVPAASTTRVTFRCVCARCACCVLYGVAECCSLLHAEAAVGVEPLFRETVTGTT